MLVSTKDKLIRGCVREARERKGRLAANDIKRREARVNMVSRTDIYPYFQEFSPNLNETLKPLFNYLADYHLQTAKHSIKVMNLVEEFCGAVGMAGISIGVIKMNALLHDVGKIFVTTETLDNADELEDWEKASLLRHSYNGCQILEGLKLKGFRLDGVRHHHERWDGTGYPDGLNGYHIPWMARVIGIADTWEALINERGYKGAWPMKRTVGYMLRNSGKIFDPDLADKFVEMQIGKLEDGDEKKYLVSVLDRFRQNHGKIRVINWPIDLYAPQGRISDYLVPRDTFLPVSRPVRVDR